MSENNSLTIFTKAAQMLAEADTIQKAKELKDLALTASDWAKRKDMGEEAIQYARSYALRAEIRMGELLRETDRAKGTRGQLQGNPLLGGDIMIPPKHEPTLSDLGLTKRESSEAQLLASLPEEKQEAVIAGDLTRADIRREIKRTEIIDKLEDIKTKETKAIEGVYDVVVIDPPWPMQKIERDERPNQSEFDYPVMTEQQITGITLPCAEDAHVFLWTTQKFLPMAFRILETWGLKYVLCMVWHKPGGFQPYGLPQYNAEFCLYAKKGNPKFIDTKDFNVCFNAPRKEHSVKPVEFYDTIKRITAGRRIDMFARDTKDGFDSWGNEIA